MAQQQIEVFFSYSRKDENLRKELDNHLAVLKRQAVITSWYDRQIEGGAEWEKEIARHMQSADIILLLVSSDFIASEYCYVKELPKAIARHEAGEAYVIPILLRPIAYWEEMPFAHLQVYPSGGLPITQWSDLDSALVDVVKGIKTAVRRLLEKRQEQERLIAEQERQAREEEEVQARREAQAKREQAQLLERQRQEQISAEEDRRSQAEQARREAQAREEQAQRLQQQEQARLAEQAGLAEQSRIREAEKQRQEQIQAEAERQAAAERARRAEQIRQMAASARSQPPKQLVTPKLKELVWNRRNVLLWIGGAAFTSRAIGQQILEKGRSPSLKPFSFEVATVNAKGEEAPRQPKEAKAFVENLGNGAMLEMVAIPGGSFQMGSLATEKDRYDDESPQHPVSVSAFLMGRYVVTQAQYEAITGKNLSNFKGAKRPVEEVSWNEAQEFCKKLSQKTGRKYRLPSEAEWEYACRAGTTTPFHFGETITTDLANYQGTDSIFGTTGNYGEGPKGKYRAQTTEVGIFPPNAFGLCDMHGNVWEWCEDVYHTTYEGAPMDGSAWNVGGESGRRVLRGGSWFNSPRYCRSAARVSNDAGVRDVNYGFRVVCVAPRT